MANGRRRAAFSNGVILICPNCGRTTKRGKVGDHCRRKRKHGHCSGRFIEKKIELEVG